MPSILPAVAEFASPETLSNPGSSNSSRNRSSRSACSDAPVDPAAAALQLVCLKGPLRARPSGIHTIIVGFVGGFVDPSDAKHPEVLFATYLRAHCASDVHAEVFSHHNANGAFQYVLRLLDTNHDGVLSDEEKRNARIIIYGHSWGASETVAFARKLRKHAIPVLLTIQLDIITKFRQKAFRIPSNVGKAVNFYQTEGLLQGRSEILASDGARTKIIGNFRLSYTHRHVNCDNYPWFVRTFNRAHHEIENDPYVWEQVAALIDAELSNGNRANSHPPISSSLRVFPSSNDRHHPLGTAASRPAFQCENRPGQTPYLP